MANTTAAAPRADAWEKLAPQYATGNEKNSDAPTVRPVRHMLQLMDQRAPFKDATSILDTGCGPGIVTSLLLDEYSSVLPQSTNFLAADFSPAMVKQVQKQKEQQLEKGNAVWERVQIEVMDAQTLNGIEIGSLSHAMGGFVFMLVLDPMAALQATRRALKDDGGILGLTCWQGGEWMELMGLTSKVRPDLEPAVQIKEAWKSEKGVQGELERAGFRNVKIDLVEAYMKFDDHREVCRFFFILPGLAAIKEKASAEEYQQMEDVMVARLKEMHPEAPGRMKGTAIVAVASK